MNLLIGVVLLTFLVTAHGLQTPQPGAVVAAVSQCVVPATEAATTTVLRGPGPDSGPGGGHQPGDRSSPSAAAGAARTATSGPLIGAREAGQPVDDRRRA